MKLAVETVYYVSHLVWLVKRGPATSCEWKDLGKYLCNEIACTEA